MEKMLNIAYGSEILHGRLNGSNAECEQKKDAFNNTTFTKKIGNRGYASSVCQKANMRKYMVDVFDEPTNQKSKNGKQVKLNPDPKKYLFDDVFGFMMAEKITLDEAEYEELDDAEKQLFKKDKKFYFCNATKKRTTRLQMSSLINVSNRRINLDFNVCATTGDSMPYKLESYSGFMAGIANFNLSQVGKFTVSNVESEYRDYNEIEAEALNITDLSTEERASRIEKVLRALEYLSIKGNQANHLTDTKPKVVILGEYSWGNNVFQGVLNDKGIDIEMLMQSLEQNEKYRLSDIYIGINKLFDEKLNEHLEEAIKELADINYIHIDNVHNTFSNYIEYMKNSL